MPELTPEIKQRRRRGIGGSDVAPALGLSPWTTPVQLWMEKTGRAQRDGPPSEAAHWGHVLEPIVADEYARRTGRKLRRINRILHVPERPWMLANFDRIVVGERAGVECKTVNAFADRDWGEGDDLPAQYLCQVHWYIGIWGAGWWDVATLHGGQKFTIHRVERNEEFWQLLQEKTAAFWHYVETDTPPPPLTRDDLLALYPQDQGGAVVADPGLEATIAKYRDIKARIKDLEATAAELALAVQQEMRDATTVLDAGGRVLATWKAQSQRYTNFKALEADHPELLARYAGKRPMRVFRTPQPKVLP